MWQILDLKNATCDLWKQNYRAFCGVERVLDQRQRQSILLFRFDSLFLEEEKAKKARDEQRDGNRRLIMITVWGSNTRVVRSAHYEWPTASIGESICLSAHLANCSVIVCNILPVRISHGGIIGWIYSDAFSGCAHTYIYIYKKKYFL